MIKPSEAKKAYCRPLCHSQLGRLSDIPGPQYASFDTDIVTSSTHVITDSLQNPYICFHLRVSNDGEYRASPVAHVNNLLQVAPHIHPQHLDCDLQVAIFSPPHICKPAAGVWGGCWIVPYPDF